MDIIQTSLRIWNLLHWNLQKIPRKITVTQGCDDLCKKCTNNISGICTSLEKVSLMDTAALDICNLIYWENILWIKAADKAREHILETEIFLNICSCCQWFELCKNMEAYYE